MYLVGSLFIIGGISLVVMGSLLGAVAIYVGGGLAWLAHNRRLPALYQIMAPSIAIALLWPLGLLIHLWMMFKDPKRFVVYDSGNPGDESAQGVLKELGAFSSWKQAIAFARDQGVRSGHRISIHDHRRFKRTLLGTYRHRLYFVEPSGEIIEPPF